MAPTRVPPNHVPAPHGSFERLADRYDQTRGGERRGALIAASLAPFLPTNTPVLDIGVGTGVVAKALAAQEVYVIGVDLSAAMLARATLRIGPRVAVGDAANLPFADASIGGAYAAWVFQLVDDVARVLSETARILRPGAPFAWIPARWLPSGNDVRDVLDNLYSELGWNDQESPPYVVQQASSVGLSLISTTTLLDTTRPITPAQAVQQIHDRAMSCLWDLNPERWLRHVEPTIRRLKSLPGSDEPRETADIYQMYLFRRD
ncbi:class I SAM-dependent methyltransferase [Frankia sp. EAN1pec]|uniref:methyltransferase domain-containing protein n=1 Tax=Parafrankia sp. (strain EAN1pec) TaxID=298653 RepID=UPI0009FFC688